jgi:chromosome segregation ATPase
MNAFGYFLRRIAWQFGFKRERKRWGAVNRETQILSEAEDLLGRLAWKDIKGIDELSGEYWQILDMDQQQEKLREATRTTDAECEKLREALDAIQAKHEEQLAALKERKAKRMEEALNLMREIENLKEWKEGAKRKFTTLKAKLKVIRKQDEGSSEIEGEIEKTHSAMARLKEEFAGDIANIQSKTDAIEAIEKEVEEIERQLTDGKRLLKAETIELTTEVGRLSKQIAEYSAKIGSLENRKTAFYYQIGRFLSNNLDSREPAIREVLRRHRPLVSRILYFRRSIAYNQSLARRSRT